MASKLFKLKKTLIWHETKYFPIKRKSKKYFEHEAIIGVGGNIGNVKKRFSKLIKKLDKSSVVHVKATSAILQNPPFGYLEQDDFYNAVIRLQTSLEPKRLLRFLQYFENKFKRIRSFKNAPRTLDLDIIFYDDVKIIQKDLIVPHPFWHERDSVLLPLSKILNKNRINYEQNRIKSL